MDLFAGIGGIRLGFQYAFEGVFDVKMVSEIDADAKTTYAANFSNPNSIEGDIRAIESDNLPEFDICMAGFPCQTFSQAGKREGFKNIIKGTLFYEVIRICEHRRPMVIFCENVKGLLSNDRGNTFRTILGALEDIGYITKWKVMNSCGYGVPQNRERVYIVAFRDDVSCNDFTFPEPRGCDVKLRSVMESDPVDSSYYLSEQYLTTLKKHKAAHVAKGHGFGYVVRDLDDDVAGALMCGGMGRERNLLCDPRTDLPEVNPRTKKEFNKEHIRVMTPREWARLQNFPEDFKFPVAKSHQYNQLGNSVTVSVIEAIAANIKVILDHHLDCGGQR